MLCRARPRAQETPVSEPHDLCPEPFWTAPTAAEGSVYRPCDVFICHADAQRDCALWLRDNLHIYGYRAFVGDGQCGFPSTGT